MAIFDFDAYAPRGFIKRLIWAWKRPYKYGKLRWKTRADRDRHAKMCADLNDAINKWFDPVLLAKPHPLLQAIKESGAEFKL